MMLLSAALVFAVQTQGPAASAVQAPAPAATPAPVRRAAAPPPAATNLSLDVRVSDREGAPLAGVRVAAEGPVSRLAMSNGEGKLTLRNLTTGTYRLRAEGDGFVTLEKEVSVHAGPPATVDLPLSPAPPPPKAPEPPPPSAVAAPKVEPGQAVSVSLPDLAEKSLNGREPVKTVPLGCSGLGRAQLLIVRDGPPPSARADVDESLYVVAGDATLTLAGKDRPLSAGWFALVPRGTTYTVSRRGRNPAILLSVSAGQPCDAK